MARVAPAEQSTLLLDLLTLEFASFHQDQKVPDRESYRQRFPDHVALVDQGFRLAADVTVSPASTTNHRASQRDTELERESEIPLPSHIDRFIVERELGRGGFAIVYLAHDPVADRKVPLKVPRPDRPCSPDDLEKLLQEARTAVRLEDHPGIVSVHDV